MSSKLCNEYVARYSCISNLYVVLLFQKYVLVLRRSNPVILRCGNLHDLAVLIPGGDSFKI